MVARETQDDFLKEFKMEYSKNKTTFKLGFEVRRVRKKQNTIYE